MTDKGEQISTSGSQAPLTVPSTEESTFFGYRLIKQAGLILVWISIGLFLEITGPTLPDLRDLVKTTTEGISQSLIFKSIGAIIGAPLGGLLCDKLRSHVDLLMSLSMMAAAVCTLCTPWFVVQAGMSAMFFINGLAEAIINAGGNAMCMKLWGDKSAAPMQSLHFGFGFGAILAPQLARPFLAKELNDTGDALNATSASGGLSETRINVAYLIIAVIVFAIALVMLAFYCVGPPKGFKLHESKERFFAVLNPAKCAQGDLLFGILMLIFLFLFYIHVAGGERAYGKFLFSYVVDNRTQFDNGEFFTRDEAATLNTFFWAFFTGGRFAGMLVSFLIAPGYMLIIEIVGALASALVLSFAGYRQKLVLWIFTCAFGFFIAPVFPSGMSWANLYMDMTSMAVCVLMIGTGVGGLIYQYLGGYLFDNVAPYSLFYLEIGYAVSLVLIYLVLSCIARRKGQRDFTVGLNENKEREEDVDVKMTQL